MGGGNFKLLEERHIKGSDMPRILTNVADGEFCCFTIDKLSKDAISMLVHAMSYNELSLTSGAGAFARNIRIPLKKFSVIFAVNSFSQVPDEMLELFYDVIDFSKYEYDFRLIYINDFAEKYSLIFSENVKERLAKQFTQTEMLNFQLLEIRNKAIELNVNQISELFFERNFNLIPKIDKIDNMGGRDFEFFIGELLFRNGFDNINVTQSSHDFGMDIIAEKEGIKYAIQCKRYSNSVGVSAIQEIIAVKSLHDCHVACVITNNFFTPAAIELANKNLVLLWDRKKLQELIDSTTR